MFHNKITSLQRLLIPITIVGAIVVFAFCMSSIGASVDIQFRQDDSTPSVMNLSTFSLGETVRQLYQARAYALMLLVVIFSIVWPYVKLLLMLYSWVIPVSYLSLERRESLFTWMDAMGKYSLVDAFVLILVLISFHFHADLSGFGVGVADLYVTPEVSTSLPKVLCSIIR